MSAKPKRSKKTPNCPELDPKVARARQRVPKQSAVELDLWEFRSAVMKYWMRGLSNQEILDAMEEEFGEAGRMGRETPTRILRDVAKLGYLQYNPPYQLPLAQRIKTKFRWLKTVDVVNTREASDVARAAAKTLLELVGQNDTDDHVFHRRAFCFADREGCWNDVARVARVLFPINVIEVQRTDHE